MNEFKVGDVVECCGTSTGYCDGDRNFGGCGWKYGRKFTIQRITGLGKIVWPVETGHGGGVYVTHIRYPSHPSDFLDSNCTISSLFDKGKG